QFLVLENTDFLSLIDFNETLSGTTSQRIGELCEQIGKTSISDDVNLSGVVDRKKLGYELLKIILDNSQVKANANEILLRSQRLAPTLSYLEDHYDTNVTVEDLAKTVYLSVPRFYLVFKETVGMPPLEYVQRLRLQKSLELLLVTDLTINEIADRVGYKDQFHYSKRFKKLYGMSPSAYRQK
ncbi:MAG: helix-turn-helix transcriptional regulator, partial [Lentisphaeria bacterium]|nr:helix-turn-helix transcriptional regulator [Lentisphaeria bacterium]